MWSQAFILKAIMFNHAYFHAEGNTKYTCSFHCSVVNVREVISVPNNRQNMARLCFLSLWTRRSLTCFNGLWQLFYICECVCVYVLSAKINLNWCQTTELQLSGDMYSMLSSILEGSPCVWACKHVRCNSALKPEICVRVILREKAEESDLAVAL